MVGGLFLPGNFRLHSGGISRWKINCDVLTEYDYIALAIMAMEVLPQFSGVIGIPRGGLLFAAALQQYASATGPLLIVDDVLTTGQSMENTRLALDSIDTIGCVIFARGPVPDWITALWTSP